MNSEHLDEERRFLLGSIRDLEREHEVGDVAADDFHALRDGYVARAAAVLREIESDAAADPPPPGRRWWRRLVIITATLAVGVAVGIFVARSAGQRLPGQSLTGGQPADEVAVKLAEGRRLLNLRQLDDSLVVYEGVLELEPGNIEATTYVAWLDVLNADAAADAAGVQEGIRQLAEATMLDETYADPHCLLAIALHNFTGESDPALVQREADTCRALDPPADLAQTLNDELAD
jgi:hypothetical protein